MVYVVQMNLIKWISKIKQLFMKLWSNKQYLQLKQVFMLLLMLEHLFQLQLILYKVDMIELNHLDIMLIYQHLLCLVLIYSLLYLMKREMKKISILLIILLICIDSRKNLYILISQLKIYKLILSFVELLNLDLQENQLICLKKNIRD